MKIDLKQEEIDKILNIISKYNDFKKDIDELQKQSEEIQSKVDEKVEYMEKLHREEEVYLTYLRGKYGNFSLQDISDTIYGE